ncbi:MAG: terminase small subunit [Akkermansia sp.]
MDRFSWFSARSAAHAGGGGRVMADLNERQMDFCRLVARGLPATRAYAQAFGCSPASAASSASRLLRCDKVREFLSNLSMAAMQQAAVAQREADDCAVGDKVRRMQMLWRMAQDACDAGEVADAVRCIAELNRMDGAYEPERVQVAQISCSFESLMDGLSGARAAQ